MENRKNQKLSVKSKLVLKQKKVLGLGPVKKNNYISNILLSLKKNNNMYQWAFYFDTLGKMRFQGGVKNGFMGLFLLQSEN